MNRLVIAAVAVSTLNLVYGELFCDGEEDFKVTKSTFDGSILSMISTRRPAGVCKGSIVLDTSTGFGAKIISGDKLICKDGSPYLQEFGDADCNGDPKSETLQKDYYSDLLNLNITFRCDLGGCDYIKIRSYDDTDDCDTNTPTITDTTTFADSVYIVDDCNIGGSIGYKGICNGDGTATEFVWSDPAICYDNTTTPDSIFTTTTVEFATGYGCAQVSTYYGQSNTTSKGYGYYYVECGTASPDGSSSSNGNSATSTTTTTSSGGSSSTTNEPSSKSDSQYFMVNLYVKYLLYLVVSMLFV